MKAVCSILFGCLLPAAFGNIIDDLKLVGLTKLANLVEEADLVGTLLEAEPLTLFAPKNEALDGIPDDIPKEDLKEMLLYHVIPKKPITTDVLIPTYKVETAATTVLTINEYGNGAVTANGKLVVRPNILAGKNSIVHEIDEVIPYIGPHQNLFLTLWKRGNFNTLIKVINAVSPSHSKLGSIREALTNPNFKLTVFAPTDEAFDKLPDGALENLLKPENKDKLIDLLKAHAVPEILYNAGLENGQEYQTMNNNEKVAIAISADGVGVSKVNSNGKSAKVIIPDTAAINGDVQAIDEFLM